MNKTIKWILIIVVISIIGYLLISFFAVSWMSYFSNPKRTESLPQEKIFFDNLKKDYGFHDIKRSPEIEEKLLSPKDTLTYTLYISKLNCTEDKQSIDTKSEAIAKKINTLNLNSNFYKYEIIFYCENFPPRDLTYKFLRKNL